MKKQLLKLECKNCGASLKMMDRTRARCAHCGQIYLIDELENEIVDIRVDHGDTEEVKRALSKSKGYLTVFITLAAVGLVLTLAYNILAVTFGFASSDNDSILNNGTLLVTFCEDVFGKEYRQITDEEFASIKYIKYSTKSEKGQSYHAVEYSFTDYQDCESEEAFQETIEQWTYRVEGASWPAYFRMFKGLTRIDTTNLVDLNSMILWGKNEISHVKTDSDVEAVASQLNPENVKVLHLTELLTDLDGIEQFVNLEELTVEGWGFFDDDESVDISQLAACTKLRKLKLEFASSYTGLESLKELQQLESLYLNDTILAECSFLKELPGLKELSIDSGEDADLSLLSYLPNLKKLEFMDYEIIDVNALSGLTDLEELIASFASVESLEELVKLKKLNNISVSVESEYSPFKDREPYDVSVLAELPQLYELSLVLEGSGPFVGLEEIMNMPGMERLYIMAGFGDTSEIILDVDKLQENENIKVLYISECEFTDANTDEPLDFTFLEKYKNVRELSLIECGATNIDFVPKMQKLEICELEYNEFGDYSKLLECPTLKELYVDDIDDVNVTFPEDVLVDDGSSGGGRIK